MVKGQEFLHLEQSGSRQNIWEAVFTHMKQAAQDSDPWQKGHKQGKHYNYIDWLPRVSLQATEKKVLKQSPGILLSWRDRVQSLESSGQLGSVANETERKELQRKTLEDLQRGPPTSLSDLCMYNKKPPEARKRITEKE